MIEILQILSDNNNRVDFTSFLTVKMSPHQIAEKIKSVWVNGGNIYYTNKEGINKPAIAPNALNSILQRLKLMKYVEKNIN